MVCLLFGFALGTSIAWSDSEISKETTTEQQAGSSKPDATQPDATKNVDGVQAKTTDTEQPKVQDPAKPVQVLTKPELTKLNAAKKADGQPDGKKGAEKKHLEKGELNRANTETSGDQGKSPAPETKTEKKSEKNAEKNTAKNAAVNSEKTAGKQPEKNADKNSAKLGEKRIDEKKRENGNLKGLGIRNGEITSEHEAQALEFASKQHPELVGLISPLKASNPKEYQRAIRELFRTSERLDNIRLREPARYDLELEAWKLQSVVRLLAARLVMESDSELQASLKDAIRKKADNRLRLMQYEKESLKSRLEQVSKEIENSTKSLDQSVDQEYERLLKLANRDKPGVSKTKKVKNNPPVAKE